MQVYVCAGHARVFQSEVTDAAAEEGGGGCVGGWGGHGALAFCFNGCRSLLPLLPLIAF